MRSFLFLFFKQASRPNGIRDDNLVVIKTPNLDGPSQNFRYIISSVE